MRMFWFMVMIVVISLGINYATASAHDRTGFLERLTASSSHRAIESFYDHEHSVFCASRWSAISCVYVPRDTIKGE